MHQSDQQRENDLAVDRNQWQQRAFENYISNNDPECCCLIGVKVGVNGNKDTNLSIHSSFALWCQLAYTFFRQGVCLCGNSNTECAFTWTRQNIIKTHIGQVGNRCVGGKPLCGLWWKSMNWMHKKTTRKSNFRNMCVKRWRFSKKSNLSLIKPVWKHIHPAQP